MLPAGPIRFARTAAAVKLQWIREPAREIAVSANHELKLDCLADGQPRPSMRWEKLDSTLSPARLRNGSSSSLSSSSSSASHPNHVADHLTNGISLSSSAAAAATGAAHGKNQLSPGKCRPTGPVGVGDNITADRGRRRSRPLSIRASVSHFVSSAGADLICVRAIVRRSSTAARRGGRRRRDAIEPHLCALDKIKRPPRRV